MNRNLVLFLFTIVTIGVFAVIVMTQVPRRVAGESMPDAINGDGAEFTLAKTDLGFSELPNGRGGINEYPVTRSN
jgi:hypothetical protein